MGSTEHFPREEQKGRHCTQHLQPQEPYPDTEALSRDKTEPNGAFQDRGQHTGHLRRHEAKGEDLKCVFCQRCSRAILWRTNQRCNCTSTRSYAEYSGRTLISSPIGSIA